MNETLRLYRYTGIGDFEKLLDGVPCGSFVINQLTGVSYIKLPAVNGQYDVIYPFTGLIDNDVIEGTYLSTNVTLNDATQSRSMPSQDALIQMIKQNLKLRKTNNVLSLTFNDEVIDAISLADVNVGDDSSIIDINELYKRGCFKIYDVMAQYPHVMDSIAGKRGIAFDGESAFNTFITPTNDDVISAKFTMRELYSNSKTLWCSRNGSSNSFSSFIVNNYIRSDYDNVTGSTQLVTDLQLNKNYTYTQQLRYVTLNDVTFDVDETLPNAQNPLMIGASYTRISKTSNAMIECANYMRGVVYHTFSVLNSTNNTYKIYLVALNDNTFIDCVSGNMFMNTSTKHASNGNIANGNAQYVTIN